MNKLLYLPVACAMLAFTGCELNQDVDGQGVDPNLVKVTVEMTLDLSLPDSEGAYDDLIPEVSADDYVRRFVVHVVNSNGVTVDSLKAIVPLVEGQTEYTLVSKFNLNAQKYNLLVWSDYLDAADTENHLHYDPSSLTPVLPSGNYQGNNEYKDCFRGIAELDLRKYSNDSEATEAVELTMQRPVARYQIVTTDLGAFRQRLQQGIITGNTFTARVNYADFKATGYNVLYDVPKNFLSYIFYRSNINAAVITGEDASTQLAFDYCFVDPGEDVTNLPIEIVILNEYGNHVSRSILSVPLKQGYNTVLTGRFMTASDDGAFAIDPDYDGSISVDFGKL